MNKLCVFFKEVGFVPVNDEQFSFLTSRPRKVGDEALIRCEGQVIKVMLLRSHGHVKNSTYLVAR